MDPNALHREAPVVSCYDVILLMVSHDHRSRNPNAFASKWTAELRAGGVDVQVLPVFIEEEYVHESALRRTLQLVDALNLEVEQNPDDLALCLTGAEIDAAIATNKIALVLSLEGTEGIGADLGMVRLLYKLGVRMISFTWNRRTMLADGLAEAATGGGLTSVGIEVLRLMEQLGIVVDISHVSEAGVRHILELASRPLVASHSNCRAVFDHPRNLTDRQLRALAENRGVIGINVHPGVVDAENPTMDRVVDHIEHALAVAGEDHVGLGPDFAKMYFDKVNPHGLISQAMVPRETFFATVKSLEYPHDLPNLTRAMVDRGLSESAIRKVLGENFLRVFREVMGERGF